MAWKRGHRFSDKDRRCPTMHRNLVAAAILVATLTGGVRSAHAGPFCMMTSVNLGEPICSFRTWEQCRASLGGVGDYCYPNTLGPYEFDLRDPAHPRVVTG